MSNNCERLVSVRSRIKEAERRYRRVAGSVSLLAVSKTQPVDRIQELIQCGQRHFGESYLQEAESKIKALSEKELEWHFIGAIQANKTRKIAQLFAWVHSVDRHKIAARLCNQRPDTLPPLNVCIQVNISREPGKAGVLPEKLPELVDRVANLSNVKLRGLMTIPLATDNLHVLHRSFASLYAALEALNSQGHTLDTLSMGMTHDMDTAIAEGATIVRIGTAIFGPRVVNK